MIAKANQMFLDIKPCGLQSVHEPEQPLILVSEEACISRQDALGDPELPEYGTRGLYGMVATLPHREIFPD